MTTALKTHGWQQTLGGTTGIVSALNAETVFGAKVGSAGGQFDSPHRVAISPDGAFLAVSDTGNFRIQVLVRVGDTFEFRAKTGTPGELPGQFNMPEGIAFSPDGARIIVADYFNYRVQIFGFDGTNITYQTTYGTYGMADGQFKSPIGVAFSPDGLHFAVSCANGDDMRVQVFSIIGNTITHNLTYNSGAYVYAIAYNHDGTRLLLAEMGSKRCEMLTVTDTSLSQALTFGVPGFGDGQFQIPSGVCFSSDGSRIIVVDSSRDDLQVFSYINNAVSYMYTYKGHPGEGVPDRYGAVYDCVFASNNTRIIFADYNNHNIQTCSFSDAEIVPLVTYSLPHMLYGQFGDISYVAFNNTGTMVAVLDYGVGHLVLLHVTNGTVTATTRIAYDTLQIDYPSGVAFSPDGSRIAIGDMSASGIVLFGINGTTITRQATYGEYGEVESGAGYFAGIGGISFSPDGTRLVVTDANNVRFHILNINGNTITPLALYGAYGDGNGQFEGLSDAAFSPDGLRVAVTDSGRIQLFSVTGSNVTFLATYGVTNAIGTSNGEEYISFQNLAFSPDGMYLIATTVNARVYIFRIDDNTLTVQAIIGSAVNTALGHVGGSAHKYENTFSLAISPDGEYIAVTDPSARCLHIM